MQTTLTLNDLELDILINLVKQERERLEANSFSAFYRQSYVELENDLRKALDRANKGQTSNT